MKDCPKIHKDESGPPPPAPDAASGGVPGAGEYRVDPKPLAAYRLGYLSYGIWYWHVTFWHLHDDESTWINVPLALDQFEAARDTLSTEIHPNVFGELRHVLNDLDRITKGLLNALRAETGYANIDFESRYAPGKSLWEKLRALADSALGPDHELRSLFEFGASLGDFQLKLWFGGPGAIFSDADLKRFRRRLERFPIDCNS